MNQRESKLGLRRGARFLISPETEGDVGRTGAAYRTLQGPERHGEYLTENATPDEPYRLRKYNRTLLTPSFVHVSRPRAQT